MAVGNLILAADYNNIRGKIIGVIGNGAGQSGYGQPIQSLSIASGDIISKTDWDLLRYDIYNALIHQTGETPLINEISIGNVIRYGAGRPNFQYNTLADQAITNKFDIGEGRTAIETGTNASRTSAWTTAVSCTVTISFSNNNEARYFFNSGGRIRFVSSRVGGSSTAQNSSWSTLLSSAGVQSFDYTHFYALTNSYQEIYYTTSSAPYAANSYLIQALSNVSDNTNGGATDITFNIVWSDAYTDGNPSPPPDQVDGTLSLIVDQVKATGPILPSGTFNITSPSFSITSISGT